MKTTLRKRYSSDFKAQIVDLFNLGKTVPQLAEEFGVGTSILYRWVRPSSSDQPAQFGSAALRAVGEVGEADELRRLRAEITHRRDPPDDPSTPVTDRRQHPPGLPGHGTAS